MTTINTLPKELLFNIFNRIDKLSYLAQCRLVCRAWSDPVERAMLGSMITIDDSNEAKMRSLYAFLQNDPAKAYLIKHLELELASCSLFIRELLQLAFTCNIECITGDTEFASVIDFLVDIVKKSPNKFDKLETLALACVESPPLELALHCRETIQTMYLNFYGCYNDVVDWGFMYRLNEFHHLTSLTLRANVGGIRYLDKVWDGCPHLQKFTLIKEKRGSPDDVELNQQDIKRHFNMKVLRLYIGFSFVDLMQYILYKFISVEEIDLNSEDDINFGDIFYGSQHGEQVYLEHRVAVVQEILHSLNRTDCNAKVEKTGDVLAIHIKTEHKCGSQ